MDKKNKVLEVKKGGIYSVFIIWGFKERLANNDLTEFTEYQLIDTNYASALQRAKLMYKKNNYILNKVIENFKK